VVGKQVAVHGLKSSEVQGYVLVPGLHFGGVFVLETSGFVIANLKIGGALANMWQNRHFLRGLRVFNFVLVPNPER